MNQARGGFLTRFRVANDTLLIDLGKPRPVLSSAPKGGGFARARYILNHQVPANPMRVTTPASRQVCCNPAPYLGRIAAELGADRRCVALMTSVSLKQLVTVREELDGLWVEGFFTVGVTNAVRVGEPAVSAEVRITPGTINIILVTNARLTTPAMVGAVQVATESKTATLLAAEVPSWTGLPGATGTGTDAVVVAGGRGGPYVRYSGTHTRIGGMIGRVVSRGVKDGLARSTRWQERNSWDVKRYL